MDRVVIPCATCPDTDSIQIIACAWDEILIEIEYKKQSLGVFLDLDRAKILQQAINQAIKELEDRHEL